MEGVDVCVELENDEFYSKYLSGGSGAKPTTESGASVSEQVERLAAGVDKLNAHLERQVLLKHEDLLTQASHVTDLESELAAVQVHVQGLVRGAGGLRDRVTTHHAALQRQTLVLERALTTCHLLRHAARVLALHRKLPALEVDPAKQAVVLLEIDELLADYDFTGIQLLEEVTDDTKRRRAELLTAATRSLQDGLLSGNKTELLSSFKVFHNMQRTQDQIDATVSDILRGLQRRITDAFDVQLPPTEYKKSSSRSGPGRANVMNAVEFKQRLWDNLDNLFATEIRTGCSKVVMLQNVLNELHAIGNFRKIAVTFWDDLCTTFAAELDRSSITVNQCIEIDFPKLLKCFNNLLLGLKCKDLTLKRELLIKWENAFLSKSLGKLLDPVRSMWHLNQVPSTDQIDNAVRVISTALSVSLGDKQLSLSLSSSVAKSIKQMNVEAEQRISMDSEVTQIIEAPTSLQQKNADICNALYYFSSQINRVLVNMKSTLHPESVALVEESLKGISSLPVLNSFATSIINSLELILMTMHDEPDLSRSDDPDGKTLSCCLYMKELQQFISRCKDIYLTMFSDRPAVDECCIGIARRCMERFVQHICNVRPLSKYGRAKLQQDVKHLEVALSPLVAEINDLGESYRQLKAFYILLNKTPSEIAKSQSEGASVPYSYVMMFLFSFGGSHLISPHACAGWNTHKLLQWLDGHTSERDRLEFVAGALQRYQTHVRQHNITTYDEVYPILLQLLEEGRKKL